jgi:hypothetical protein
MALWMNSLIDPSIYSHGTWHILGFSTFMIHPGPVCHIQMCDHALNVNSHCEHALNVNSHEITMRGPAVYRTHEYTTNKS